MALLLGRRVRARRLVHRCSGRCGRRRSSSSTRRRPRSRRDLRQARARAGADRRPGALGRPLRRRPRRRALRHDRPVRRTSPRPGSTSSSGSGCRCSRCCSATSGGRSARGGRSPTGSSGSGSAFWAARRARSPRTRSASAATRARSTLFAFVALELCYSNPANPRALAFAIALYSYVALFGMLAFGRDTWMRAGEGFAILFAYIAPDRAVRRPRGPDPAAAFRSPASRAPSTCRARCCSSPSRSARSGSTATAARSPGRTSSPGSRRRTSSTEPGTGELLVTGLNLLGLLGGDLDRARARSSAPARSPARW